MTNPIAALKTIVQRNEFKRRAANPDHLTDHALYLLERKEKGKEGQIYVKREGLFGKKRLSSQPPLIGKKKALKAYNRVLGEIAQKNVDTNAATTRAGLTAHNLSVVLKRDLPANEQEAAAHTKELEQLLIQLARQENNIASTADDKTLTSTLCTKKSTPVVSKPKIAAAPVNTKEDLPELPTKVELSDFYRDLNRGLIKLPKYDDVTRLAEHFNRTHNTISDRQFPSGERNEANDLLDYIAKNVTAKHTFKDGQWQEGRQTNTFGGREFDSRLKAARFLFTQTNFLKEIPPLDAADYLGVYQNLIKEERQKQQRVG